LRKIQSEIGRKSLKLNFLVIIFSSMGDDVNQGQYEDDCKKNLKF
jgi:hypothetical protein